MCILSMQSTSVHLNSSLSYTALSHKIVNFSDIKVAHIQYLLAVCTVL